MLGLRLSFSINASHSHRVDVRSVQTGVPTWRITFAPRVEEQRLLTADFLRPLVTAK
jgi:hypothetical protein